MSSAPNLEKGFISFLESTGNLDAIASSRLTAALQSSAHRVETVLLELGLLPESRLADLLAQFCGYDRIMANELPNEFWLEPTLPERFLRDNGLLVVDLNDDSVSVATSRPLETDRIRALAYFLGRQPIIKIAEQSVLSSHLARLNTAEATVSVSSSDEPFGAQDDDIERLRDVARNVPTIKLLNRLIATAVERSASDIHLEPLEDQLRVRLRIDGALQTIETLPRDVQAGLTSRIKILARLNIAEQRLPQDGRIRVPVRGRDIDLRVSTTPVEFGESVALRILDRHEVPLDFDALGFFPSDAARLKQAFLRPNGIFLVTGPTGSGKTTTLYTALNILNRSESKLFSVEDPVEYRLHGVNQIQVKPQIGLDFAAVLRAVLRQDPDMIMIGEMRDLETARIAVQASLTGHFVLSTLHTNSAAAAITRLQDMGIEDFLLASCLRGILSQRLVRKLCTLCRVKVKVSSTTRKAFQIESHHDVFGPSGCPACRQTGYRGRTVVYEYLEIAPEIRHAISGRMPEAGIQELALNAGLNELRANVRQKILDGTTSPDEAMRVISELVS